MASPRKSTRGESLRSNLIRNNGNDLFLLVAPHPLDAGREYEVEFQGKGPSSATPAIASYYVGARGNWYPRSGLQFATYDLTFRYPGSRPGDARRRRLRQDRRRIAHYPPAHRFAHSRCRIQPGGLRADPRVARRLHRGGLRQPAASNGRSSQSPRRRRRRFRCPPPTVGRRRRVIEIPHAPPASAAATRPTSSLQELATEIASELEFMAAAFRPAAAEVSDRLPRARHVRRRAFPG